MDFSRSESHEVQSGFTPPFRRSDKKLASSPSRDSIWFEELGRSPARANAWIASAERMASRATKGLRSAGRSRPWSSKKPGAPSAKRRRVPAAASFLFSDENRSMAARSLSESAQAVGRTRTAELLLASAP